MERTGRLDRGDGVELAWAKVDGTDPCVVFLTGFRSDMTGQKATALRDWCAARGQAMLRFDFSGTGQSAGRFEDGTIGRWAADARAVIEAQTEGKVLLVGSSMGGWIALLTALAMPERIAALVGVAAAPDFTEALIWPAMSFEERRRLMEAGLVMQPSDYGEPSPITRALIEDGRKHLLLQGEIGIDCPVRLLHGQRDTDVPWEMSMRVADRLRGDDVILTLVKDGDHRLSRPQDIALLCRTVGALLEKDRA